MKRMSLLFLLLFALPLFAEIKWHDPAKAEFSAIQNQAWSGEIGKSYQRFPPRAKEKVRPPVWDLSQNSAGLAIHFYTNADSIQVRYGITGSIAMWHMPATGKSGVDLYAIDADGKWLVTSDRFDFGDSVITYTYVKIIPSKEHKRGYEYHLYLPLYSSVNWMEIGVPESAEFKFIPAQREKPIVVYGTSIAQGGCASRPAMGWSNILSRKLDYPVVNLAFSGNGPLEKEVVDLIDEIDGSLYIYDCLPNMDGLESKVITERMIYGVKKLREKHSAPILLVEHPGYRHDGISKGSAENIIRVNKATREAYQSLKKSGVKNLYYLTKEEIDLPDDGAVDNTHPSDYGMQVYANAYEKIVREILAMPLGAAVTAQPASQRKEPDLYEWKERHHSILQKIEQQKPKKILIGDWMREDIESAGYLNLGYSADRIENVLWRIYHGELDGYQAEKIVVMAGTNNLGIHSAEEIVDGLDFLLKQIQVRQPKAKIKVAGLLPRKGMESDVKKLNKQIFKMAARNGCDYIDVGKKLLAKSGKIDEKLFVDGRRLNDKGDAVIVGSGLLD